MPARSFDPRFQRSWGYFPRTEVAEPLEQPDLLFSFIGSPSSRCRRALFELRHPDAVIEEVRRFTFYDPGSPDFERRRQRFRSVMGRSRFVLCPRGRGTSSIRLYEALAHGRVPVIISDGWVAPDGPDWESFSIRWPERDAEGLVGMLEDRDADWPQLSRAARSAYEEFFAPSVCVSPDRRALLRPSQIRCGEEPFHEKAFATGRSWPRARMRRAGARRVVCPAHRQADPSGRDVSRAMIGCGYDSAARVVIGPRRPTR